MNEEIKNALELSSHIRRRIMEECRITRVTLFNWYKGNNLIPFWAQEKIDAILKEELGESLIKRQDESPTLDSYETD